MIDKVVAVGKAYTTRVGSGPFVTENEDIGDMLHNMGREFGATTGRARRCGWLDSVLVRYAVMINGADELAITNLDGLDGLDTVQICTAYTLRGKTIHYPPSTAADLAACVPVYETPQGWKQDLSGIKKFADLPQLAKDGLEPAEPLGHFGQLLEAFLNHFEPFTDHAGADLGGQWRGLGRGFAVPSLLGIVSRQGPIDSRQQHGFSSQRATDNPSISYA
jgi:hypothetical protein